MSPLALPPGPTPVVVHARNSPRYAAKFVVRFVGQIPRGLARIIVRFCGWLTDRAGAEDYRAALAARPGDLLKLKAERREQRYARTGGVILVSALALAGVFVAELFAWPWHYAAAAAATVLVVVAGAVGRRADAPRIVPQLTEPKSSAPGMDADGIATVLSAAVPSIARAVKDAPESLRLVGPAHRDGPGWAARIDLPPGVTVEDVARARIRVASGLRASVDRLQLAAGDHAGQVLMWVADRRPSEMPIVGWPLVTASEFSMFDPIPIGVDVKGNPVAVSLMWGSLILGGVPQMGKTAALRLIQTAAVLDPSCRLLVFDLKGSGDAYALQPAADVMRAGDTPEDLAALRQTLTDVQAHMRNVYAILRDANEPKLTRELAAAHDLGPVLLSIDECQLAFVDDEIKKLVEDLVRRGPAAGVIVCLATQRPTVDSIPSSIRDNTTCRIALRVQTQVANDAILGTGAYSSGMDATQFTAADRGIGIVAGEGADFVVTKLALITTQVARMIAEQHPRVQVFEAEVDDSPESVLDQVIAVWPDGEDRASCAELAAALGWGSGAEVTRALKGHGVESRPLDFLDGGVARRLRGVRWADLERARLGV